MDQSVYWMLELSIKEDQKDNLKSLVADMSDRTKKHEPGAINYEWHVDSDKAECHIYERYEDSDALMTHLGNFQEHFAGRFFEILDIERWMIYGNPSDQVKEALSSMGAKFMNPIGGFSR